MAVVVGRALNFGIYNYSVGQFLLAWEEYASRFDPGYVFIFISRRNVETTVEEFQGRFAEPGASRSRIRPIFRIERLGYVPLSERLLEANADGIATRFRTDNHLNEAGHEIFAEALYSWLEADREVERAGAGAADEPVACPGSEGTTGPARR